ncbi:hypothetical protein AAGG74_15225 [Bacillus mexicanus]|uniref:hypothetical protein n=1 Tax=Bacillus mexicanus TaxID=2834415 RepID=UPI003D2325B1
MGYTKPICDCGSELIFTIHQIDSMDYRISDRGKILKSSVIHNKEIIDSHFSCNVCGNHYRFNYDENDKIIRGEIRRKGFDE